MNEKISEKVMKKFKKLYKEEYKVDKFHGVIEESDIEDLISHTIKLKEKEFDFERKQIINQWEEFCKLEKENQKGLYEELHNSIKEMKRQRDESDIRLKKVIKELKKTYVKTKVTEYSEGYSNGWTNACEHILKKMEKE